ncbi:MAG TPA: glycoside hydrolase family 3 C-terminal domain-containing protein [Anaeromyxobacter sp.]|nr:glycoside hydrolase family 3 C-terminal domain-containing protein [Anaeromyxobacter sp.]
MKHLGPYNGTDERRNVTVQDQALHEIVLAPFEAGVKAGGVAALMASYQPFMVDSRELPRSVASLVEGGEASSTATSSSWPLDEGHYSAEHPWLLNYLLRRLWNSKAFVGPDYGAIKSASAILQGLDMEPGSQFFGTRNPNDIDPTGSSCADKRGAPIDCGAPGAVHVAGFPSTACGPLGCGLADAALHGLLPLAVLRQSLGRMLYQEERFGMLGCNEHLSACGNPGGVAGDRSGRAGLPEGKERGPVVLGTRNGDAAVSEAGAERGAVLLRNQDGTFPITPADLAGGVLVTGGGAEHLVAAPFDEASSGLTDRIAIGPLRQLRTLSSRPEAFDYVPANDATGRPVPSSALSTTDAEVTGFLSRAEDGRGATRDPILDFTRATEHGPLPAGRYTWTGYIHVPRDDVYTFRFQHGDGARVSFALDGSVRDLQPTTSIYHGYYYGAKPVPVGRTVAGYTEAGLYNQECHAGRLPAGWASPSSGGEHRRLNPCPARLTTGFHALSIRLWAAHPTSFRFAWSRAQGDIVEAATEARGKALAIVFANDDGVPLVNSQNGPGGISDAHTVVARLPALQEELIEAVAAANPRTVVVLNTGAPVIVPWVGKVRSVLEMWNAGQEGGTATARLLLGEANPSGHTPVTWPLDGHDTVYAFPEPADGLYPGSRAGPHPERLNGLPDESSSDAGHLRGIPLL